MSGLLLNLTTGLCFKSVKFRALLKMLLTIFYLEQTGSMADIVYPQGCRPITDDLGPDELVRRLKVCSTEQQIIFSQYYMKLLI